VSFVIGISDSKKGRVQSKMNRGETKNLMAHGNRRGLIGSHWISAFQRQPSWAGRMALLTVATNRSSIRANQGFASWASGASLITSCYRRGPGKTPLHHSNHRKAAGRSADGFPFFAIAPCALRCWIVPFNPGVSAGILNLAPS
jgi:hypothetical protein